MPIDWKYTYKRRGWTIQSVFNSLSEKTWEAFVAFHQTRGIECPEKIEFDQIFSLHQMPNIQKEPVKKEVPKKKRVYTRKRGSKNERAKTKK